MVQETATPLTPTPASEWKGRSQIAEGIDLLLPSDNVIRIRKMSPQTFLTSGVIPDPLSDIVAKAIHTKKGLPPAKVEEMSKNHEQIQASLEMFDRVLAFVVIAPVIKMPPQCTECHAYFNVDDRHRNEQHENFHIYHEGERDPGILYCDQVDLTDKVYVFQYCLGATRDLETFRSELPAGLGDIPHE